MSMPLTELVWDRNVYPRTDVSSVNVNNIKLALKAGRSVPPIIADEATKKIIDGRHRYEAHEAVYGADANIDVELRHYDSEAAMLLAAVELNVGRGLDLEEFEKRKVVLRLGVLGVSDDEIAVALQVPEPRITKLRVRIATVVDDNGDAIRSEPLKFSVRHLTGQEMSEAQALAHKSAPGNSWLQVVSSLRKGLRAGLLPNDNERLVAALEGLVVDIADFLNAGGGSSVVAS